ncbi:hypothetical protein [Spirochaeta lutea]|uniref:Outer membrane protein beta-barrel domain-containing protein n=1 Tax=Spirochaeta lutea TaxID=1480694 RepID=A0A098QTH2_9SPIO|nr:hypothetical protein [Spirochaeta lutea]KGE70703.1 hypothetical protein DC28_14435 [Spirochaeta lutea]
MNKIKQFAFVTAMMLLAASPLIAKGGGGTIWGTNMTWIGEENLGVSNLGMTFTGGFGYGVARGGAKIGGFGLAVHNSEDGSTSDPFIAGGFGGMLLGTYGSTGRVSVATNLWLGVGGYTYDYTGGHFGGFGQADIEVGLAVLRWFQISGYAGYASFFPITGSPGRLIEQAKYTPVLGLRFTWGSF